jgi:hypothetical protein
MFSLIVNGTPCKGRQVAAAGYDLISLLRSAQRLLAEDDGDGVD